MPLPQREQLCRTVEQCPQAKICEFTDDITSYMEAADAIVSMGGYNTVCEILSLSKRAVVVPRIKPVQEQLIRAERMASFGLFTLIHPEILTPENLMEAVFTQLNSRRKHLPPVSRLDLNALPRIEQEISKLLFSEFAWSQIHHTDEDFKQLSITTVNSIQ